MIFFKNGVLAKIGGTQKKRENTRFTFFFIVWNISVIRFKIGAEIAILDLAKGVSPLDFLIKTLRLVFFLP